MIVPPLGMPIFLSVLYLFVSLPNALATVEVVDDTGATVRSEKYARRIVSLSPHITENLFAAGLGPRIVATVAHADYPEQAKHLPRVGGYNSLNLEALIEFQPDLIITWGSGISYEAQVKLEALGIPIYVSEPKTLEDIHKNIQDFARLGGLTEDEIPALHTFRKALADHPRRKATIKVFYQIWNDPIQTLNGSHIVNDVFSRCGLYNAFSNAPSVAPILNIEGIIAANPEIIVASGIGNEQPAWLKRWKQYGGISAVQNKALYALNPDLLQRPTPRIIDGLTQLCHWSRQLREASPNTH